MCDVRVYVCVIAVVGEGEGAVFTVVHLGKKIWHQRMKVCTAAIETNDAIKFWKLGSSIEIATIK